MKAILIALIFLPWSMSISAGVIEYNVTDLGTLGGINSSAYGINNKWQSGVMQDLRTFGGERGIAPGINNNSQAVGMATFHLRASRAITNSVTDPILIHSYFVTFGTNSDTANGKIAIDYALDPLGGHHFVLSLSGDEIIKASEESADRFDRSPATENISNTMPGHEIPMFTGMLEDQAFDDLWPTTSMPPGLLYFSAPPVSQTYGETSFTALWSQEDWDSTVPANITYRNYDLSVAGWTPMTYHGVPMGDIVYDSASTVSTTTWTSVAQKPYLDMVGNSTFPLGYFAYDSVRNVLMFKLRVNGPYYPGLSLTGQGVFAVMFNFDTGSEFGVIQMVLGANYRTPGTMFLYTPDPPSAGPLGVLDNGVWTPPEWGKINSIGVSNSGSYISFGPTLPDGMPGHNDYGGFGPADDGSSFGGNSDTFVYMSIPWSLWQEQTMALGVSPYSFRFQFGTSGQEQHMNGDHPDGGWSEITNITGPIPEPSTMIMLISGLSALLLRRKRHQSDSIAHDPETISKGFLFDLAFCFDKI